MIVELNNGKKYMVTWKHELPEIGGKLIRMDSKRFISYGGTKCMIWEFTGRVLSGDETSRPILEKKLIATGESKVFYKDQFSKETGRKISMTRALNEGRTKTTSVWEPGMIKEVAEFYDDGLFPENDRKAFWDAYFKRKPVNLDITLGYEESKALLDILFRDIKDNLERAIENCPESTIPSSVDAIQSEVVVDSQKA